MVKILLEPCYGSDEEFVWVVVLGAHVSNVVVCKIYVVKVVHKEVYLAGGILDIAQG